MSYLSEQDIMEMKDKVRLLSIAEVDDVSHYFLTAILMSSFEGRKTGSE